MPRAFVARVRSWDRQTVLETARTRVHFRDP